MGVGTWCYIATSGWIDWDIGNTCSIWCKSNWPHKSNAYCKDLYWSISIFCFVFLPGNLNYLKAWDCVEVTSPVDPVMPAASPLHTRLSQLFQHDKNIECMQISSWYLYIRTNWWAIKGQILFCPSAFWQQACKPRSYASSKLWPSDPRDGSKATSIAKKPTCSYSTRFKTWLKTEAFQFWQLLLSENFV